MKIRFIHTGDIHFGVENYGKIDSDTGIHSRFKDFIDCFEKSVDYGVKLGVDFFLICGDVYHTSHPSPTQQKEFAKLITKLIDASIPVIIVVGNHDNPVTYGKATALEIFPALNVKNVHIITKPEIITLDLKEKGKFQILGFPWPTRSRLIDKEDYGTMTIQQLDDKLQNLCTHIINVMTEKLIPDIPSIFAGHLALADAQYSGSERTTLLGKDPVILTSTLGKENFLYVALGHIHKFQELKKDPPVVYCGSIERVDFNEENEAKGFCLIEYDGNEVLYRHIKSPSRKFITIERDVRESIDPTGDIIEEINRKDIKDAIIRIIYTTDSIEEKPLNLKDIHEALTDAFYIHGIIRKCEEKEKLKRASISENLSLMDALDRYIEQEQLDKYSTDIKHYASLLEREVLYDTSKS